VEFNLVYWYHNQNLSSMKIHEKIWTDSAIGDTSVWGSLRSPMTLEFELAKASHMAVFAHIGLIHVHTPKNSQWFPCYLRIMVNGKRIAVMTVHDDSDKPYEFNTQLHGTIKLPAGPVLVELEYRNAPDPNLSHKFRSSEDQNERKLTAMVFPG